MQATRGLSTDLHTYGRINGVMYTTSPLRADEPRPLAPGYMATRAGAAIGFVMPRGDSGVWMKWSRW
ncbi:MAG: hypothetical protein H0T18_03505 [Chloroflexia bacterium]|nr:hypothetical protein [Chloroflexia bacterium]